MEKKLKGIEIFAGSQSLTKTILGRGHTCYSLDNKQVRGQRKLDYKTNFFDLPDDFFLMNDFDFVWFGMPCTALSKASGGKHFDKIGYPLTNTAITSNEIATKIAFFIRTNPNIIWYIENPAGGFFKSNIYKQQFCNIQHYVYRLTLKSFGFPTQKQTDIFTNSKVPLLSVPVTRQKGRYQEKKFSSLTLRQRQSYPNAFCHFIVDNIEHNFLINC